MLGAGSSARCTRAGTGEVTLERPPLVGREALEADRDQRTDGEPAAASSARGSARRSPSRPPAGGEGLGAHDALAHPGPCALASSTICPVW